MLTNSVPNCRYCRTWSSHSGSGVSAGSATEYKEEAAATAKVEMPKDWVFVCARIRLIVYLFI